MKFNKETKPDIPFLYEMFDYLDGKLYWKHRPLAHFKSKRAQAVFNSKFAGKEAGTLLYPSKKYRLIMFSLLEEKHFVLAHSIVWAIHFGGWPSEIDHIDGDGLNNKIENIRQVCHETNMQNKSRYKNNSSGVTGVQWYKVYDKWVARAMQDGKKIHLGYTEDFFEAVCLRKSWEVKNNYHENHGR